MNELLRVPFDFCVPTVKVEIEKVQCIDFKGRENHVLLMHIEFNEPVYLRFGRAAVPVINDRPDYKFEIGKGVLLREGRDMTIVTNGITVSSALEAAKMLASEGIQAEVINIHTVKPLDEELVCRMFLANPVRLLP